MDDLPTEIKEMICNDCDFMMLKTLRLTSRSYTQVTTPRIFKDFYMAFFFLTHLQRLMDLSMAPHIAKLVENFFFIGKIVPEFASQKQWEKHINLRQPYQKFIDAFIRRQQQATGGQTTANERRHLHGKAWDRLSKIPWHMLSASGLSHHFQRYNSFRHSSWGGARLRTVCSSMHSQNYPALSR